MDDLARRRSVCCEEWQLLLAADLGIVSYTKVRALPPGVAISDKVTRGLDLPVARCTSSSGGAGAEDDGAELLGFDQAVREGARRVLLAVLAWTSQIGYHAELVHLTLLVHRITLQERTTFDFLLALCKRYKLDEYFVKDYGLKSDIAKVIVDVDRLWPGLVDHFHEHGGLKFLEELVEKWLKSMCAEAFADWQNYLPILDRLVRRSCVDAASPWAWTDAREPLRQMVACLIGRHVDDFLGEGRDLASLGDACNRLKRSVVSDEALLRLVDLELCPAACATFSGFCSAPFGCSVGWVAGHGGALLLGASAAASSLGSLSLVAGGVVAFVVGSVSGISFARSQARSALMAVKVVEGFDVRHPQPRPLAVLEPEPFWHRVGPPRPLRQPLPIEDADDDEDGPYNMSFYTNGKDAARA